MNKMEGGSHCPHISSASVVRLVTLGSLIFLMTYGILLEEDWNVADSHLRVKCVWHGLHHFDMDLGS